MQQLDFTAQATPKVAAFQPVHEVKQARARRKERQAFYTPLALVEEIVEAMDVWEGATVLEPSAGDGRFIHALLARGAKVSFCEIDDAMRARCEAMGATCLGPNFFFVEPTTTFHFVAMNPPFSGNAYRKHIERAFQFLRPGGKLWTIAPGNAAHEIGHAKWDLPGCEFATFERLSRDTFKDEGTKVATILATIHKPDGERHECYGFGNVATGCAAVGINSDERTYEAIRRARDIREVADAGKRYLMQGGGTAYGVDWQEIWDYLKPEDGDQ